MSLDEGSVDQTLPKILVLGKTQQGKSSFIKRMASGAIEVVVGDGKTACTKDLRFHTCELRDI